MTNKSRACASIFHDIASMYKFVGGQLFHATACGKTSKSIAELAGSVSRYIKMGRLKGIPGVGE